MKIKTKETYQEPEIEMVSMLECEVIAASLGGDEIEDVGFENWI